jgi:hypothetical protein
LLELITLLTLQCQKQTQKRQKILTKQFSLDQNGTSMCSLLLNNMQIQDGSHTSLLLFKETIFSLTLDSVLHHKLESGPT